MRRRLQHSLLTLNAIEAHQTDVMLVECKSESESKPEYEFEKTKTICHNGQSGHSKSTWPVFSAIVKLKCMPFVVP